MPTEFVPLLKDSSASPAPPGAAAAKFSPLLQTAQPAAANEADGTSAAPQGPTLTVQRTGERITQIQIRCTCGQLIELECDY